MKSLKSWKGGVTGGKVPRLFLRGAPRWNDVTSPFAFTFFDLPALSLLSNPVLIFQSQF